MVSNPKRKNRDPCPKRAKFLPNRVPIPKCRWEAESLSSSMILLGTCRPYLCANEFEKKHACMILLETLPHTFQILQIIVLKSDYSIKWLGGLTGMQKVLQQRWICKIGKKTQDTYQTKNWIKRNQEDNINRKSWDWTGRKKMNQKCCLTVVLGCFTLILSYWGDPDYAYGTLTRLSAEMSMA